MAADFSGYATKSGLKCSDGLTIMPDAFKHNDGIKVPLVWQHQHNSPDNVLGHAILENRKDGVYAYAYLNGTPQGQKTKELVSHGDIEAFSIYANKLTKQGLNVMHGDIKEVSLVLSGANPGALIDSIMIQHGDSYEESQSEVIIYTDETLEHDDQGATVADTDTKDKTVKDVFETLSEEQKNVVYYMLGEALADSDDKDDDAEHSDEDGDENDSLKHNQEGTPVTRNLFDQDEQLKHDDRDGGPTLSHSQIKTIFDDAKKMGSFKEAFLAHAEDYGITNIEQLFPEAGQLDKIPEWITRRMEWVGPVLNGARKLPFARFKSRSADLTHDEARAKGYIKGNVKKEQYFSIAGRETGPTTIYKKQKLDRDDIIDITDFDVVNWLWQEMRFMLNEEIARAILIGDGREVDDPDKIDESKVRPIAHDDPFYTDVISVPANVGGSSLVEAVIRGREPYMGSGEPTAFMTRSVLNDMLLVKDKMGRRLYRNRAELASELEVSSIILVPILADSTTDDGDILMILVNMSDYSIGTDKGGQIATFDDFDIDLNQYKYLIEGRMSGGLSSHKTAQVVVRASGGTSVTPIVPTFVPATGVVTIPSVTGVTYYIDDESVTAGAQTAIAAGETVVVEARPNTGYFFPHNTDGDWEFTRDL